ncbi:nucleotide-binding universal stress UspA family protein [Nocardioides luteus]|uniref:universal stress protein n=1 Tax=Nocardioides luteus TaxID=1844 RepID=UPI0028569584|nr:universal stress protein [Nocardioides luteus]MDR7311287.1 nucleotide-binding universal stress UspA family protein [Nocardioides luteus]
MAEKNRILVGIDGGEGGRAAIAYAAAEAGLDDADLWLVHVTMAEPADAVRLYAHLPEQMCRPGTKLLQRAAEEAAEFVGAGRVSVSLVEGRVVPGLVHAAATARLVVLGDDRRRGVERIVTGTITHRVAGHAPVPVVVVPTAWSADEPVGRVLVAVKDCGRAAGLIARALSHASDRDAELVVLHAWQLDTVYDDMTLSHLDRSDWENATRRALEDELDRARRRAPCPDVEVRIEVRHGQPARVIADRTRNADLLVIGRRRHVLPTGRLGSTGRALLRESRCPVEVHAPIPDVLATDDLVLEQAGRATLEMTDD